MNAIIWYHYQETLTGTVFNTFEYYISILEHNPDIQLILVEGSQEVLDMYCDIYEERYFLDDLDYRKNMMVVPLKQMRYLKFDKVLVLDFGTIPPLNHCLNAKEIIAVSELHTDIPAYRFKNRHNVTHYGEMPFVYKDKEYRMKLAFDRFRPVDKCEEAIFVSSRANKEDIEEKLKLLPNKPVYKKSYKHLTGFFSKWDEMLYVRSVNWYDPHPRIFLESAFYGKKMHYYNDEDVKDGGWYRWKDVNERGLEDRTLTKEDEIIKQFI